MIYGFFGDLGSGKTLTMTKYAEAFYRAGYKIYSNYWLSFPHTLVNRDFLEHAVERNEDITGDKILFCLDEFDMYIDSRKSMTKGNVIIGYFIKQIRKKNIKIMYATQMENNVDRRLRGLTRTEILCESVDININLSTGEILKIKVVYNSIYIMGKFKQKSRFIANKYFSMYNTKQLIID